MKDRAMSLLELMIASALMLATIAGIAAFLQQAAGIASSERGGIDLQQNRRGAEREITRSLLLAGRGGLPAGRKLPNPAPPTPPPYRLPAGLALRVDNNVPAGRRIIESDGVSPQVATGSDVLTVRAVTGSLYRLDKLAISRDSATAVTGQLVVPRRAGQDLADLEQLLAEKEPLALLIGSAADIDTYGVAELVADDSRIETGRIVLAFVFYEPGNPASEPGRPAKTYAELGPEGVFPLELYRQDAATVGILRELRYYIRHQEPAEVPLGEDAGDRLARAELYPGLERAAGDDDENLKLDIAYGVVDLQVALAFDTSAGGLLAAGDGLLETADGVGDDWLWNAPGEVPTDPPFAGISPWAFQEVEVTLLARSPYPERSQRAAPIERLGDRVPSELNSEAARRYRRSAASWRVQPRNL